MTESKGHRIRDVSEECPHCYSFEVEGYLEDGGGDDIRRDMSCNNCNATWSIPYVSCDWEPVEGPDQPIPDPNRHVVHLRTTSYLTTSSGAV